MISSTTTDKARPDCTSILIRRLLDLYAEMNARKAVDWLCEDCGVWFVVTGDRHPEECPRCGSATLTAFEETGVEIA